VRSRHVHFEAWAVQALAQALDPELRIATGPHPERDLRAALEAHPDPAVRTRGVDELGRLEAALATVAAAEPATLRDDLAALDAVFVELTGRDATRNTPGGQLATGSAAGIVQLWNPSTGAELGRPTQVAPATTTNISFDPGGDTFVTSGGGDGIPKLWTTSTLQQLGSDFPGDPGAWLNQAYTPDGREIIVVSQTGRGWVWPATLPAWEHRACQVAGRNLTHEEWSRFVAGKPYTTVCPSNG
jgi:hypothetical protein